MNYKIAVVGDKDSILPFQMIGFDIFDCHNAEDTRRQVTTLAKNQYGIIYLTEQLAALIPETIAYYKMQSIPAIILIPNYQGTLNIGMDDINKNVEKAIGQNILN